MESNAVPDLITLARGKRVLDVGCGHGRDRAIVENAGRSWIRVKRFKGGAHGVVGAAGTLQPYARTNGLKLTDMARQYLQLECLRQSAGFTFVLTKAAAGSAA